MPCFLGFVPVFRKNRRTQRRCGTLFTGNAQPKTLRLCGFAALRQNDGRAIGFSDSFLGGFEVVMPLGGESVFFRLKALLRLKTERNAHGAPSNARPDHIPARDYG